MATDDLSAERLAELRGMFAAGHDLNRRECEALLRAAEERERMQTWVGLMSLLDQHWPEDVFPTTADDAKRDDGARIVSLLRLVERLRAENETLRKRAVECMPMLETLRETLGSDLGSGGGFVSVLDGIDRLRAQRDALVAVLEQCDVFLRVHAKPDNELKTAVQVAIRAAKENR